MPLERAVSATRVWMLLALAASAMLLFAAARAPRIAPPRHDPCSARATPETTTEPTRLDAPAFERAPRPKSESPLSLTVLEERASKARDSELSQAMRTIAEQGGDGALAALTRLSRAKRGSVARAALVALDQLDTEAARNYMLAALGGDTPAAALEYFKDAVEPRAIPRLEQLAQTSGTELTEAAVAALVTQGGPAHASLTRLVQSDGEAREAVIANDAARLALRPTLRTTCIAALRSGTAIQSCWDLLSSDRSTAALAALSSAAHDRALGQAAIQALSHRGDPAAVAVLLELDRRGEPWAACEARQVVLSDVDSRSLTPLLSMLRDAPRTEVIRGLLELGAEEAARALDARLRSSESRVRARAVTLLAEFGPKDYMRSLRSLRNDQDAAVASLAEASLERLAVQSRSYSLHAYSQ
ncbi:MAG TPA: hypothetical protein VFQ35_16140 [Polyangiaceae bacterium]|nr:hypothetical protein [Polyangiaceae bacterium]